MTKFIQRKTLIYKTAVEYGDYTLNHVQGCYHGCKYPCYAFLMAKRFGRVKSYEQWIEPSLVENAMDLLDKEIPKFKDRIKTLHLCFTTDPFMNEYEEISNMSVEIIKKANSKGIKCSALTKGLLPLSLAELSKENEYGITLISLDETFREKIEPNAAPYQERINRLKELSEKDCKTWVSIEPYPTPNIIKQDFSSILEAIGFVDKIIFGRTNYNPEITKYKGVKQYYNELSKQVIDFSVKRNIEYHIKNGTLTE
ncbi:radical SAM protein [Desulfofalx alkaliphila]|uniref:radical SAM protein n=1 Tax=Desulfofalx alkaliphila TaxID=105483 RepID=UPI001EE461F9|nr:radical SAM protein [Desulfofalx alkaliphila]